MIADIALRRLFRVVNGGTPVSDEENWGGDVPWATPIDLAPVDGGKITSTGRTLTRDGLSSGSAAVPAGSIVLSTRAPIGYVAETTSELAFNQGCRGLVPRVDLDLRFFRYQLLARRSDLVALGQGSTFAELSSDALAAFKVSCPPKPEQRDIADFLDVETIRIDALIEKKRRQRDALIEKLRTAVSAATRADAVIDKDARERAERAGWRSLRLRRCFSAIDYGIGQATTASGVYAVLGMGHIAEGRIVDAPTGYVEDVEASLLLAPGDLLFNRTNSLAMVGKVALFGGDDHQTTFASYLVRLRTNELAEAAYLNYLLNTPEVLGLARSIALPSIGQANLNPGRYTAISIVLPPVDEQRRIVVALDRDSTTVDHICDRLSRQTSLLREHRQALIAASLTGQLDRAKTAG